MSTQGHTISESVNRYGKQLLGFVRGRVGNNEDAEDLVQDVWYQFSKFDDILSIENIGAWLYRVARNKITDRFRKKKSESLEDFIVENEDGEIDFKAILLADSRTPDDEFFKKLFWDELMQALNDLPEKQRQVFIQNELDGLTLQQIADQSGENLKTIISRKGYAVKYLRERLGNLYHDLITFN